MLLLPSLKFLKIYLTFSCKKQAIRAYIYRDPAGENPIDIVELEEDNGVWRTKGPKSWEGCYYVYEVNVYHPSTLQVEKCYANDPYARGYAGHVSLQSLMFFNFFLYPGIMYQLLMVISVVCGKIQITVTYCRFLFNRLSPDGRRTFLINLKSDELKPEGWDDLAYEKPAICSFSDLSIYEMHIRDFR